MTVRLSRRTLACLAPALALPAAARAQNAEPPRRGPNGGRVVIADGHPVELVVAGTAVTLFLVDERGQPEATRGASGRIVLQQGAETTTVTLQPAEPNRMEGTLPAAAPAGARLVFTATMRDGHRLRVRFVLD